ncbi:LCP family protein [Ectobacillus sp. sgz5001026]|uniref:LCP family protein n=1 Tax=Ectobacillus sp. sgz5001026 TaxID=3242473 RepID=UPI0036D2FA23
MDRHEYLMQRKRIKRKRRRVVIVSLFMLVFLSIGYYAFSSYSSLLHIYSGFKRDKSNLRAVNVDLTKKPFSVLVMGIEDYATNGENGRTDSLIFLTVNPNTKQVTMVSLPRDSRVTIAGRNTKDKLNAAHAYGGEKMAIETVEQFLNVPVDHYIKIDFKGFKEIVNAVDGVTVDVPFDFKERSDVNWYKEIQFTKGPQQLNGEEALAYVRMRKEDPSGDFGRTKRQRQMLAAVVSKLSSPSSVFKINDVAKAIGDNIKTDIDINDGLALYQKFAGFDTSTISTLTLQGKDETINGIYYFAPDSKSVNDIHNALMQSLEL